MTEPVAVPTFLEAGPEREEGRPPLILLHGIGGNARYWAPQLASLSLHHRVISWDNPGYGGSPLPEPFEWKTLSGALERLLDACDIDRAVVVGHSMGGMVAQAFAAEHPERLAALVLSGTSAAFGNADGDWQRSFVEQRLKPFDEGMTMADLAPKLIDAMTVRPLAPEMQTLAEACMGAVPPETYRAALKNLVTFDGRANLARLTMPVLVLAGEHDPNAPARMMERMAERIPGARFACIPGVGHLANLEDPQAFDRAVLDFVDSLEV